MNRYIMTISRLTVDKLGVKLYDKVSAVIAELVANSYDADATEVQIAAPMGEFLAVKKGQEPQDKGYIIEVIDNGVGIHPDDINAFYLKVGAERRTDPRRGDESPRFRRKVMGRKGIGKLAPFGICQKIEVITAGGDLVKKTDGNGSEPQGYLTAHFILDRHGIMQETDDDYEPEVGQLDGTLSKSTGTTIRLSSFIKRKVPTLDLFERQLSQRFGIQSPDWGITLYDSLKTPGDPEHSRQVGRFSVDTMPNTKIEFEGEGEAPEGYRVIGPEDSPMHGLTAGFFDENRNFYPLTGWVAYSRDPYKDDLMAGVRIYCRGKIAAQTSVFDRRAGFTGEHSVRSYLVGELHADWLDTTEDLIQTDRRDIMWSHEIGQAFQEWGQNIIRIIGTLARDPLRRKVWELFQEKGQVERRINETYPLAEHEPIRDNAWDIIERIGKQVRREEVEEDPPETVDNLVQLGLMLAPHVTLDRTLRHAAEEGTSPLAVVATILKTARIAELSSFGRIAEDRIKVIERLNTLKDDHATDEASLQELIYEAPWLIDPQWSPITANQAFGTLKQEFEKFYRAETGHDIKLNDFSDPAKRPDFVLSNQGTTLQIVEIKRPGHTLLNVEVDRINAYVDIMTRFLSDPAHTDFKKNFADFHVTLVCDGANLTGVHETAFNALQRDGRLTWLKWRSFLLRTKLAHQAFLDEADRQRKYGGS